MTLRASLLLTLLAAAWPTVAAAKGPEIYPLAKVQRGQKGYGLTVFQGTTPERFEFEVVGVLRNYLPRQDLILVKSDDPKIIATGFAKGMSGSPLYLDGKVVCAFSYGWSFNQVPIGGCTPLETMVAEARTPLRGPESTAMATIQEWQRLSPLTRFEEARDLMARADAPGHAWLTASPLPTPPAPRTDGELVRASVPLTISGLGPTALEQARKLFEPYGLEPMQAGGGGDESRGPTKFEMGGAIAVILAKGDFSAAGTGTVSYVDGNQVLAFGHPMFQMGETWMPVSVAEIHTIIPAASFPFKLSSPLRTLGALVQDRQSMIAADVSQRVDMIPVDVKVKGPSGNVENFHAEVVKNRFLTPQLVMMTVANAAGLLAPDIADCTITIESTLHLRGFKPLSFVDYVFSQDGAAGNALGSSRGLRVLGPLLFNPWAPIAVDRVDVSLDIRYQSDVVTITGLRLPRTELPYGKPVTLEVQLTPYAGKPYVERVNITVPERLAGETVRLEIVPGDAARMDVASPETLEQMMEALRTRTYPGNVLVTTLYLPDEGVALNGRIVPDLPDSALDTVRQASTTRRPEAYKPLLRLVTPAKRVVTGRQEITFRVEEKRP